MPKRELIAVELRPAKNGFISEARTRTKRSGQGGGPEYDHETDIAVHPSIKHAQAHLAKLMGGGAEPEEK